ncbi:hypothetical protein BC629DRAFT_1583797 [Irpex lacteus]|nr:hypothetical protein BC629DRAFT_1583797 [Irpex lacteus]
METPPAIVPPYELRSLVDAVLDDSVSLGDAPKIQCAQAIGPDLYAGCSNGELLRLSLHRSNPSEIGSYSLVSRQSIPSGKAIDDIVLTASISRALILSDRNIFIYTLPNLDLVGIQPLRNVVTFAVDEQHLRRGPPRSESMEQVDPIDLCVLKRTSIALYSLRERLIFQKDIPLPSRATLARRTGKYLCVADQQFYNMIDLEAASLFPLLPLSQAEGSGPVKPFIIVISDNEFLILSWTGASTLGLFITGDGDPVRGTLEWPTHPKAVAFDHPHVMTLMADDSIEIYSIETQTLVQTIPPPVQPTSLPLPFSLDRAALFLACNGLFVPSAQRSTKLRTISVPLLRNAKKPNASVLNTYSYITNR